MPKLIVNTPGGTREITGTSGMSVMEIIRDAGIDELQALCGGGLSCATCHVYVAAQWLDKLPPLTDDENELLDSTPNRDETSRLSCQLPFGQALDGVEVTIAPEG